MTRPTWYGNELSYHRTTTPDTAQWDIPFF